MVPNVSNLFESVDPAIPQRILLGILVFLLGVLAARVVRGVYRRVAAPRLTPQHALMTEKAIYYTLVLVVFLAALNAAGVNPNVLLGAAGVLTLALGFASQTTVSNLISGIFLVGEQTFKIGDSIQVGTMIGVVTSIDLLSVKLRTYNNVLVRLPNEALLKAEITNLTHFPIRRLDVTVNVGLGEDLHRIETIFMETAEKNRYCLDEPRPTFWFEGYGESSVRLRFSSWFATENYWETTSRMQQQIFEALQANDVEIPYAHRVLVRGGDAEPELEGPR